MLGYKKLENLGNNLNEFTENHRKPPRCYQEEAFDIMMEMDDIIEMSSFEKGKEILESKYNISFK